MTTQTTTQRNGTEIRSKRRSAALVGLALGVALGAVLAGAVALAGTAQQADAASSERIVFTSNRTGGTGVDNPTGDYEVFRMNPDGTGVRQLTFNKGDDFEPVLSPDGTKVAYHNRSVQASDGQGGGEIFVMNASDGSGKKNLTNSTEVDDYSPVFSPSGRRIAYTSEGDQSSNPDGDNEVYAMRTLDGSGKKNLTNNDVGDYFPTFSPDGTKIAYNSEGIQNTNPEGDTEVYVMNASDGSGQTNLTNNGSGVTDGEPAFSADGTRVVYLSYGKQTSNPEGDWEIYRLNTLDGKGKKNLTDNRAAVDGIYYGGGVL